ncbi:SRPBCC family protein [Arthrobacter sp. STN4]|uniref:SRPBCC family protein n=1 Tax=Arthrobacter sp. STN4 TaxID=2923276 RepID=UPI00211A8E06|nr:SRPBCC family protein [Arthrobacter sp. STN4]MCQ9166006.1 SRPBCC family protein [Arthrobacter sp. STN4]
MPAITTSVDVDRPAAGVFSYATDPAHFSEWQQGVVSGSMGTPGSLQLGSLCLTTRRIGLRNRTGTAVVTRLEVPTAWSVRGTDGPIRANVDLTVEPLGADRSRVSIAVDFEGHGIGALLVPLVVRRQARREMPGNLAALKRRLEGRRDPTAG